MEPSSPIETIQTLGKYTLFEKIGEGYLGSVFRGFDQDRGRAVAVRILCDGIKWEPIIEEVYSSHCRAVAGLRHENIASVLAFGKEGKHRYIVLESLGNSTLKNLIAQKPNMTVEAKLSVMIQVAEGLNHAHKSGILHRCLEPTKIHVATGGKAKIRDFAIAGVLLKHLPHPWIRFGAPIYLAPEQIQHKKSDMRSDIFSAGAIFYELITYRHPFHDRDSNKALDNILQDIPLPTFESFPDEPPGIWPILKTCLRRNPDDRYQSMDELLSACRALQRDLAEDARLMLSELYSALAPLRIATARADTPDTAGALLHDIEKLLRGEKEADYVSLDRMMNTLLMQYPALRAASGSISATDSSVQELMPEMAGIGISDMHQPAQSLMGMEIQKPLPVDKKLQPPPINAIKPDAHPDAGFSPLNGSESEVEGPFTCLENNLGDFSSITHSACETAGIGTGATALSPSRPRQTVDANMHSVSPEVCGHKDTPRQDQPSFSSGYKQDARPEARFSSERKTGLATYYRRINRPYYRITAALLALLLIAAAAYIVWGTNLAAALTNNMRARMSDSEVFASALARVQAQASSDASPASAPAAQTAAPDARAAIPEAATLRQQSQSGIRAKATNHPPKESVERIAALIGSGNLSSAKMVLDDLQRSYPTAPQIWQLRKQLKSQKSVITQESMSKKEELPKADQKQREEEWNSRLSAMLEIGQYRDASTALNQWMEENPESPEAHEISSRVIEIQRQLKVYASAMAEKNYPEAISAILSAEKLNPADANLPELRRQIESRRVAARSSLSIYRLGAKATLLLDGRLVGSEGELENESLSIGHHIIAIESGGSPVASIRKEFIEGQRVSLVYDVAKSQLRSMADSDRELISNRKAMEEVRSFDVEHDHGVFRGSCRGVLMIDYLDVAYRPSEGFHGFRIPFKLLKLQAKGRAVSLINVSDNKTYQNFKFRDEQDADKFRRSWDELKAFSRQ